MGTQIHNSRLFFSNRNLVLSPEIPTAKVLSLSLLILFLLHIFNLDFAVGISRPNTRPRLIKNALKLYVWLPLLREERSERTSVQCTHTHKHTNSNTYTHKHCPKGKNRHTLSHSLSTPITAKKIKIVRLPRIYSDLRFGDINPLCRQIKYHE